MEAKLEKRCLSHLAVARLASGQRAANAEEHEHLDTCALCRAQLTEETRLARAAAQEPVPAAIVAAARPYRTGAARRSPSRHAHRQHALMAVLAIVMVGGMAREMLRAPPGAAEHVKGSVQVFGAVKDNRNAVRSLADLDHLSRLQPGDTLQVQVQAADKAEVTLTDADDQTVYYQGTLPEDGWLPVGVQVTNDGPLHLTLRVCSPPHAVPCLVRELR